jgi:hypothetical protein
LFEEGGRVTVVVGVLDAADGGGLGADAFDDALLAVELGEGGLGI